MKIQGRAFSSGLKRIRRVISTFCRSGGERETDTEIGSGKGGREGGREGAKRERERGREGEREREREVVHSSLQYHDGHNELTVLWE